MAPFDTGQTVPRSAKLASECRIRDLVPTSRMQDVVLFPALARWLGPLGAGVAMVAGWGVISFVSQKITDLRCSRLC